MCFPPPLWGYKHSRFQSDTWHVYPGPSSLASHKAPSSFSLKHKETAQSPVRSLDSLLPVFPTASLCTRCLLSAYSVIHSSTFLFLIKCRLFKSLLLYWPHNSNFILISFYCQMLCSASLPLWSCFPAWLSSLPGVGQPGIGKLFEGKTQRVQVVSVRLLSAHDFGSASPGYLCNSLKSSKDLIYVCVHVLFFTKDLASYKLFFGYKKWISYLMAFETNQVSVFRKNCLEYC